MDDMMSAPMDGQSVTPTLHDASMFYDEDVYRQEMATVFHRSWLFVGHETMIPNPGDYITTYMADDAVIVTRDRSGEVKVLLNKCRHRGNKVCLFDRGNTSTFHCSYHGWSYDTSGRLRGVPLQKDVYPESFDREAMSLVSPSVAIHKGLIFARWAQDGPSLEEYLGADLLWYLDNLLLDADPEGLHVTPGFHRYVMPVNWKLLAENFGGDMYHFGATHGSVTALSKAGQANRINFSIDEGDLYSVTLNGLAPHGLLQLGIGENFFQEDLRLAKSIGDEAVEWLNMRYWRQQELLAGHGPKPYSFHVANVFPNFSMIGMGTALYARGLILWVPRGPRETEVWEWCLVEKSAPRSVKERMVYILSQRQSAAGLVAPDDHENFERMSDAMVTNRSKDVPYHYGLGEGVEAEESLVPELPGNVRPAMSETYQRSFYRHWHRIMEEA
jgi:phenylpropionate dioxygenase-like ring-hydroxylating dioxygenase large terminal subunit